MRSLTLPLLAVLATLAVPPAGADDEPALLHRSASLTTVAAERVARAALAHCSGKGYLAGVTVADRMGVPLVFLRHRLAGAHTVQVSMAKARTAASFRTPTSELAQATQPGTPESGIRDIPGVLMLGGGIPIEAGGSLVGAIGVSGAPGGAADDECAVAGIEAVQADLEFAD